MMHRILLGRFAQALERRCARTALSSASTFVLLCCPAAAQFAMSSPVPTKVPGLSVPSSGGGFLAGNDDCAAPHRSAGTGFVSGVPFTTGTTGATGQNESLCQLFGTTGIADDVWFDWTAPSWPGHARLSTCSGYDLDTKLALYALATCPADGSALACADDSCYFQTAILWAYVPGASYTIQIGLFPGATGGSGTFSIVPAWPLPCGPKDDGTSEISVGLSTGGETGWLTAWEVGPASCHPFLGTIRTAYGTAADPSAMPNGGVSRYAVYRDDDHDYDPRTGLTMIASGSTIVTNAGTDVFNWIPLGCAALADGIIWILFTADHLSGQYPAPMDLDAPTHTASMWVLGSTSGPGTLNLLDLGANDVPPMQASTVSLPLNWLTRAEDTCDLIPRFWTWCYGSGSFAPCGCGNESVLGAGTGCNNSTGLGARLSGGGSASISAPNVLFKSTGQPPNQPGLLFQGTNLIAGGDGVTFGDGIRCCGTNVRRIGIQIGNGTQVLTDVSNLGLVPGELRCYQRWYRDPQGSPCGSGFNLSNALMVLWSP